VGPTVEAAVHDVGFEVQAVDWVWRKVVGESLVDPIIKPITGDFEKITQLDRLLEECGSTGSWSITDPTTSRPCSSGTHRSRFSTICHWRSEIAY
jgi:hypothetical protein